MLLILLFVRLFVWLIGCSYGCVVVCLCACLVVDCWFCFRLIGYCGLFIAYLLLLDFYMCLFAARFMERYWVPHEELAFVACFLNRIDGTICKQHKLLQICKIV